jgi:protection-of-telomeres protein 1
MWSGGVQLLAHRSSEFHSLSAASIPRTLPLSATAAWHSTSAHRPPTAAEMAYVIGANSKVCELGLPSIDEFQHKAKQAMNIKEKFSLLKDVKPGGFYDILGEVAKVYWGHSGPATLHLTDYTTNTLFYNHSWGHHATSEGRDGDEFGYIKTKAKTPKEWPGPYGKTCIQLTLFDGHADFVREENVVAKQWVALKNVQVNFGKMGGCLEGFMRGDRDSFEGKMHVQILKHSDEPDKIDARWKDAVSRKREWWKKFEKQKQDMIDEAAGSGDKRKRGDEVLKKNSKQRRHERRAVAEEKAAKAEAKVAKRLDLNEHST